jgi:hypothetical protein
MDETKEFLWTKEPDWVCPNQRCRSLNSGFREKCRICGYDSNCGEFPWYDPMPPYDGLPKEVPAKRDKAQGSGE